MRTHKWAKAGADLLEWNPREDRATRGKRHGLGRGGARTLREDHRDRAHRGRRTALAKRQARAFSRELGGALEDLHPVAEITE